MEKMSYEFLRIGEALGRKETISQSDASLFLLIGYSGAVGAMARKLEEDAVEKAKGKSSDDPIGKNLEISETTSVRYCSFCEKSQHEIYIGIAGPAVFICDKCVERCSDIIREGRKGNH